MKLTDTRDNLSRDLKTLTDSTYFHKGKFDGITGFDTRGPNGFALTVKWRNHEHYRFRITAETRRFGIVKMSFSILPNFDYFDESLMNHHLTTLVYTEKGESLVKEMHKQFTALANLTVLNARLTIKE